jgi:hypothetical protein
MTYFTALTEGKSVMVTLFDVIPIFYKIEHNYTLKLK